jgi:hypothetical protein
MKGSNRIKRVVLFLLTMMVTTSYANTNLPSDTRATKETKALFKNMMKLSSKGTMIGHQDALSYGIGWFADSKRCDMKDVCGSYPAVMGWDIGHLELGQPLNLDSVAFDAMKNNIIKAYNAGAISTISWHARNPLTGSDAWDISSDQVVKSVLPGGSRHILFNQWLDRVASFMLSLKGKKGELIPIIFRPYHELSGSWFWWGKKLCTKDEYISLWRYTASYLRSKGVHNMLLAYSMADYTNETEFTDRYPGDEYVDLVGFDSYQNASDITGSAFKAEVTLRSSIASKFAQKHAKLFAVTEAGYESIPDSTWFTNVLAPLVKGTNASFVLLWRNAFNRKNHFYMAYPGHSSAKDFVKMVNDPAIFTSSEIGKVYK